LPILCECLGRSPDFLQELLMRFLSLPAALIAALSVSAAAMAQPAPGGPPPVKVGSGQMIYSADGAALGRVEYVQKTKDGALQNVAVIRDMRVVHIPGDSLAAGPKGTVTSLTRADVDKLN
jgi:hypothetical protein